MPAALLARVKAQAAALGTTTEDAMNLTVELGLARLERATPKAQP